MDETKYWYKIEIKDGNTFFLETIHDYQGFCQHVRNGWPIEVLRRIIPVADNNNKMSLIPHEKLDPLLLFCKKNRCSLNSRNILYFTEIDEQNSKWKELVNAILGEKNILTPNKGLIV